MQSCLQKGNDNNHNDRHKNGSTLKRSLKLLHFPHPFFETTPTLEKLQKRQRQFLLSEQP